MTSILSIFNNHLIEFIEDIESVFPEDVDIKTAKNAIIAIKKTNPKLIPQIWYRNVAGKYRDQIEIGDCDFFINKDYTSDCARHGHGQKIMEAIDRLREPVKNMNSENQAKTMKYVQNLSKLCYDFGEQLLT
jgi:uncharacterized protein (UPF0335 family)